MHKPIRNVMFSGDPVPKLGRCLSLVEHESESWSLSGAAFLGVENALIAGLNPEYVDGELSGYWKVLRCGCVFVCVLVPGGA